MLIELLVRVVDKVNEDDEVLDAQCRKAGDVVCWKPSPAEWGIEEVKNPDWRIIKAELSEAEANALISPELPDKAQPDKILRKNQMRLDVATLDSLSAGKMTADQTAKVAEINATIAEKTAALESYAITKSDTDWERVVAAEKAVADIAKMPVDADLSAHDVMATASLKEPLLPDAKDNVIGPADPNVIGGS